MWRELLAEGLVLVFETEVTTHGDEVTSEALDVAVGDE